MRKDLPEFQNINFREIEGVELGAVCYYGEILLESVFLDGYWDSFENVYVVIHDVSRTSCNGVYPFIFVN